MHQRGYIYVYKTRKGQQQFQEQSIHLNQVRQNATRHLPEEKCSQVLGLIESTLWFSGHRLACGLIITSTQALLSKTSRQSAAALPQPGSITDHTSQTPWEDMKRHLQSFDESLPACPCTSKARARIGQHQFQEQSIHLNQVRQNATRHLPEEKCSQVLGLIESTLWFSGHRLACGLIITSTQALLPKSQDHLRQQSKASFDSLFAQLSFFETPHLTRFQSSTK